MRSIPWMLGLLFAAQSFSQYSFTVIGTKQYSTWNTGCTSSQWPSKLGTSDIWGYVDGNGAEYAVYLGWDSVRVVSIPDMTPVGAVVTARGGTSCNSWQKLARFYKKHMYVSTDGTLGPNAGLQIIDMAGLESNPKSIRFVKSYAPTGRIACHTFDLDTAQGYAYIGNQAYNGFRVVDIRDPENPAEVTVVNTGSHHDNYIAPGKNLLYVALGSTSYAVYDVTNKSSPVQKKSFGNNSIGYSHNIAPSVDGNFGFSTDETNGQPMRIWNLDKANNYANPTIVKTWVGANQLAHNAMVYGNLLFVPHYSAGLYVLDITNPVAPVELAHYDTYPANNTPGYWGCFGLWLSPKGYVVTSNMDLGNLIVLKFNTPTPILPRGKNTSLLLGAGAVNVSDALGRTPRIQAREMADGAYFSLPSRAPESRAKAAR